MAISLAQLEQFYPRVYHMAEENTWESIKKHGLLSTTALLDMYKIKGDLRHSIESQHRPESVKIESNTYGSAIIRDQKPLRESALNECLIDVTPTQWYETLNNRVFFWLTEERLLRLLSARAYRQNVQCVLTIDTNELLKQYSDEIKLSPINSGSTIYKPVMRGSTTFLQPSDYPFEERKRIRGRNNAIAELTVDYSIPNIADFTVKVEHIQDGRIIETIFNNSIYR
jgi:hypothetical protein